METNGPAAMRMVVERHTFESRVRVTPVTGEYRPSFARVIVDEPSQYFDSVQLEYFKTQRMESLSETVIASFPKRNYDSEDWSEWDVSTVLKGRNRKAQLTLIDGFDPAVFASKDIAEEEIIGLFASELVEEVTLPADVDDSRDAIWLVALVCPRSLYKGPALHFSSIRGGNAFRFMRHCRAGDQSRVANTSLDVVWMRSRPYLVVRAACAIVNGSELLYDWGDEFLAKLQVFDLGWAAIASHALHQRISDLSAAMLVASGALPQWERPVAGVDITFDATGGCARALDDATAAPMHLRNESPPSSPERPAKRRGRAPDFGLAKVGRQDAFAAASAEFIAKLQPESNRCKRVLSSVADKTKLPDEWQSVIKRDFHDRAFELIHGDGLEGLSVRRIDLQSHHVLWNNPPCRTQFSVVADISIAQGTPLLVYKGRLCIGDEADEKGYCVFQCPIDKADIVVDAWRTGNEGRFVNDSLGAHQTQPNCELEWTWCDALKQPILFIVALREIRRGEELLADYDAYWKKALPRMLSDHANYLCCGVARVRQLEACLRARGVNVPAMRTLVAAGPDTDNDGILRTYEPHLYARDLIDNVVQVNAFPLVVERIIGSRINAELGVREYLVVYVRMDASWNKWVTASAIDAALLAAFEGGAEPPPKVPVPPVGVQKPRAKVVQVRHAKEAVVVAEQKAEKAQRAAKVEKEVTEIKEVEVGPPQPPLQPPPPPPPLLRQDGVDDDVKAPPKSQWRRRWQQQESHEQQQEQKQQELQRQQEQQHREALMQKEEKKKRKRAQVQARAVEQQQRAQKQRALELERQQQREARAKEELAAQEHQRRVQRQQDKLLEFQMQQQHQQQLLLELQLRRRQQQELQQRLRDQQMQLQQVRPPEPLSLTPEPVPNVQHGGIEGDIVVVDGDDNDGHGDDVVVRETAPVSEVGREKRESECEGTQPRRKMQLASGLDSDGLEKNMVVWEADLAEIAGVLSSFM